MKTDQYKLMIIAGARPNFMKIAPLMRELKRQDTIRPILVHTGQHYDQTMSQQFFDELEIPAPAINLDVGSASHAVQTARIMERFEPVCLEHRPDAVLVVGDVNSTAACVLTAVKLGIRTIHYEAGLRSRDRSMPEEINRLVTDSICDLFFTTSTDADDNLLREGQPREKIHMVGNLMIDTLVNFLPAIDRLGVALSRIGGDPTLADDRIPDGAYAVMTFHRPNNVDEPAVLTGLVEQWLALARDVPLVFPVHPRTHKQLHEFGLWERLDRGRNILLCQPLGYLPFMKLVRSAALVITDSGGVQEETTFLKIPCLTVRPSTERPVTIWQGSNRLIEPGQVENQARLILDGREKFDRQPPLWDGRTAGRIVAGLQEFL